MKYNNTLVSIITPSYNQGEYLSETLDSIIGQSYQDWECIIINDGSSDNTEEIALTYCKKDKRFKYIYQDNQGVSAARNNGISNSHGKYILPVDGDDIISPTYLEKAVSILDNNEDVKVVYGDAKYFGAKTGLFKLKTYRLSTLLNENCIFNSALYRRKDFDRIGGYDERMLSGWEDWEFWISLLKDGGKVYKLNDIVLFYRIKAVSRNTLVKKSSDQCSLYVFEKHKEVYRKVFFKLWMDYEDITSSRLYGIFKFTRKIKKSILKWL